MNKRKRVATLKHRRRRIRYEELRKAALAAGGAIVHRVRHQVRPQTTATNLGAAVATIAEQAQAVPPGPKADKRRVASAPAVEAATETAAPARRTRRTAAPQPKAAVEAATETAAPARRTRRRTQDDRQDTSSGEQETSP